MVMWVSASSSRKLRPPTACGMRAPVAITPTLSASSSQSPTLLDHPHFRSQNFPAAMYPILKAQPDTWLCLKYCPHGGCHGHPDKNSFLLYSNKQITANDPGTSAYGVALHKEWYRATIAHNTLTVDETNQKESTGSCLAFITDKNYSAAMIEAGTAIDGTFRRSAFLLAPDLLV